MKPAAFSYTRPATLHAAVEALKEAGGGAKVMAGGQSLGPMLNLRLAQPETIVDITAIPELTHVREAADTVQFGACVTTGAIEDGRAGDPTGGFMSRIAGGIAYRAVRNRGTIGGSIAHADPAADWMTTLTALGAEIVVVGSGGERSVTLDGFMTVAYSVALAEDELISAIRIRRYSPAARFGYFKFCRKRGEFAEAMAAVVVDPELSVSRAVVGATDTRPVVLEDIEPFLPTAGGDIEEGRRHVASLGISGDEVKDRMHGNAFARALGQLAA